MTNITIVGYKGRMGHALINCAACQPDFQLVGKADQGEEFQAAGSRAHVVIDFSFHEVSTEVAQISAEHKKALVIGTTGHTDAEKKRIVQAAAHVPIVWA